MSIATFLAERHAARRHVQAVTSLFAGLPLAAGSPWPRVVGAVAATGRQPETRIRDLAALATLASDNARLARAAGSEQQADALEALGARLIAYAAAQEA